MLPLVDTRVRRDGLASRHDHDPVDVALDRDHLERERPRDAVAIGVEGDRLVLVDGDRGIGSRRGRTDASGSGAAAARSSARRSSIRNGPKSDCTVRCALGLAAIAKERVQFVEIGDAGHRRGEPALHGLDGALGVGLLVAAGRHAEVGVEDVVAGQRGVARMELTFAPLEDQRGDGLGVVPPDFLGDAAEELEGGDHAFEDRLGALERQGHDEGGVGVGPGGDEEGDEASAVGEVDVDVTEIGFEALAGEMAQRDEGFTMSGVGA